MKSYLNKCTTIFFLILVPFIINIGCEEKNKLTKEIGFQSLDDIKGVPDWLKLNVDEAFPLQDFNIWVPTNNFQTSSLIRVPRFPRKISDTEIEANIALRDFEIISLQPGRTLSLKAVKNEQVSAQIAVGSKIDISNVRVSISDMENSKGEKFYNENVNIRFVKYVEVQRARSEYDWSPKLETVVDEGVSGMMAPNVVADPLMEMDYVDVPQYRAQPIWFTFEIPQNASPGIYEGYLTVSCKEFGEVKHKIKLQILDLEIPNPKDYKFHLDLWVNPSAIAEYYHLEHWSKEHWNLISKYLEDYASYGGKNITTTITHEPWRKPWINNSTRSQIQFGYRSMVKWIKNSDDSWAFDFSVFDKYVEMATSLGISEDINAYSLAPFHTKQEILYFDIKEDREKTIELNITDFEYRKTWSEFLKNFKKHLIEKRIFTRTYLGFDEKPANELKILYDIIENSAPEFLDRIVVAGHPEAGEKANNLSISYMFFPNQLLEYRAVVPVIPTINKRKSQNRKTTFYLCAEPSHPNTLTYSPAIESELIPWLALKYNTDGYLRWAYNNWTKDPFRSPVFIHNQGDDYYVYPGEKGPISSIRWELLKEGIEDYELFRVIKEQGYISKEKLQDAVDLATRNQDGRYKKVDDIINAREILLSK